MLEGTSEEKETLAMMAELWNEFKDEQMERVALLERMVAAIGDGDRDGDAMRRAEREAHQLVGVVGTFGFLEASRLAREMELILRSGTGLSRDEARRLAALMIDLRGEMEKDG